jgi:hypothetical protein
METCRRVLADAAGAFVITLLVGFVLASLSAAGVVTMTLATIFLALAWLVGIWFTFLIKPIVEMSLLHKWSGVTNLAVKQKHPLMNSMLRRLIKL